MTNSTPTNPVVNTTALRAYPGWTARQYLNGSWDAVSGVAVSPMVDSFGEAVGHVREEVQREAGAEYGRLARGV